MVYGAFTTIFCESVHLLPVEINKYFPDENLCKEQISTFSFFKTFGVDH